MVFFGLKVLGVSEAASISAIMVIIGVLAVASLLNWHNALPWGVVGAPNQLLAFFGMAMFSFVAFFSVPQAVEGLDQRSRLGCARQFCSGWASTWLSS